MSLIIAVVLGTVAWGAICSFFKLWGSVKAFFSLWILCVAFSITLVTGISRNIGGSAKQMHLLHGTWECDDMTVQIYTIDTYDGVSGTQMYYDDIDKMWTTMIVDTKKKTIAVNDNGNGYKLYKYKVKKNKLTLTDQLTKKGKKYKLKRVSDSVDIK